MIEYFISLLILMKSGTSQYSRPTTAKKTLPSPKIFKKAEERQKVKTEHNEIDPDKLYDLMYALLTQIVNHRTAEGLRRQG
jgi:hypothetical protein